MTVAGVPDRPADFAGWVEPHLGVLAGIARSEVGVTDADDVVQDALVRAWRRRSTFRPERGAPRAWLAGIVLDQAHRPGDPAHGSGGSMNDEELDQQLQAWGTRGRTESPAEFSADDLPPGNGRRYLALAAAAAVVVAVAGSAVVISRGRHPVSSADGGSSLRLTGSAVAPAGYRAVTVHGLTIDVPAAWPIDDIRCGTPMHDTVIYPQGAVAGCAVINPPKVTSVQFGTGQPPVTFPVTTQRIEISHAVAYRDTASDTVGGSRSLAYFSVTYRVPSLNVWVTIKSPAEAAVQKLAASLRLIGTDSNGCQSLVDPLSDLPKGHLPARAGAAVTLIPGSPTSVVVCRYQAGLVERGARLSNPAAASLVSALNSQPAGFSEAPAGTFDSTFVCSPAGATRDEQARFPDDTSFFRIEVGYAGEAPLTVYARYGTCGNLGASNGTRSIQRTQAMIDELNRVIPFTGGYPESVVPVK